MTYISKIMLLFFHYTEITMEFNTQYLLHQVLSNYSKSDDVL